MLFRCHSWLFMTCVLHSLILLMLWIPSLMSSRVEVRAQLLIANHWHSCTMGENWVAVDLEDSIGKIARYKSGVDLTKLWLSNSLKPIVRPSVRPSVRSSVRQNHLWARRPKALRSAGARKKPPVGGLNFLVYYIWETIVPVAMLIKFAQ